MGGYIGATAVGLTTTAADVQGDITSTDTTPELILKNTSEEDTEGGREGKITFKGEQSGGEESTLAQIESAHDGTSDDQKGDLIFKTNDGSDGASPTEAMRIDSAQNVTIGDGTVSAQADADNLVVGSSTGNNGITIASATNGNGSVRFADTGGTGRGLVFYDHDADNMRLFTAGSERMRIDSGGNVGIGTSSPNLHGWTNAVTLNTSANGGYEIGQSGTKYGAFALQGDGRVQLTNFTANPLTFQTNNTERMRIDSGGKIGIGTDSPLGEVTIAKDAGGNAPTSVTAANTYLQLGSDDFGPSNNGKFMIGFGYTDATNTNSPAYIGFEETSTSGDTKGDLTFYTRNVTTDTAPTERMRIDEDGIVTKSNQPVYYYVGGTSLSNNTVVVTKPATAIISSSDYSTSTGRFTAPVAGKYIFTVWGLFYPVDNSNTITVFSRKNGSTYGHNVQQNPYYVSTGNQHHTISATVIVDLAANDYHEWAVNRGSNTGNAYVSQWNQSGYLLG
jgi:hypothetical protein